MEESKTTRFAVSLDDNLLERFDQLRKRRGYESRSQAIRDLIRDNLVEHGWDNRKNAMGTITLVFDHHKRNLSDTLTDIQHRYHSQIISNMHVHLDHDNCLEVIVVEGKGSKIRELANHLGSTKGVKHSKLTLTTGGQHL